MRTLITALLLAISSPVLAQGLADAARKAEEQRKATASSPHIEIVAVPGRTLPTLPLSKPEVEHYAKLRMAMAQMWRRDMALFERLRGHVLTARSLDESLRALDSEPEIVKLFAVYNYSSETFLAMTKSLAKAERIAEGGINLLTLPPEENANYTFVARNRTWLSLTRGRIYKAELGLSIW